MRRVYGPYKHGFRWRIVITGGEGGRQTTQSYATEEAARDVLKAVRRQLKRENAEPLDQALLRYRDVLKARGIAPGSVKTELYRIDAMCDGVKSIGELTPVRAKRLYETRVAAVSAATHRCELGAVKRFSRWLAEQGVISRDPFAKIKAVGRKRRGKKQLTIDESRKLHQVAVKLARAGDLGALGTITLLQLGIRAGELVGLKARDVDDGGRVMWIRREYTKTDAGERRIEVPDGLVPLLVRRAGEVESGRLFPFARCWPNAQVKRLCKLAEVEVVCAQSLRGMHATLATDAGATSHDVARALGHTSIAVTEAHYTDELALARAKRKRAQAAIGGGQ